MFKPNLDHNMIELLLRGLDKVAHKAKCLGHLLQEALPDSLAGPDILHGTGSPLGLSVLACTPLPVLLATWP